MRKYISGILMWVFLFLGIFQMQSVSALAISSVRVVDDLSVALDFSSPVDANTVRVRITRTRDAVNVTVSSIEADTSDEKRARIRLNDRLDPSSSYSLIVLSAKWKDGSTITDGVDAITEFATTASLVKAPIQNTLTGTNTSANTPPVTPSPSSSVQSNTWAASVWVWTGQTQNTATQSESGKSIEQWSANMLPETGPNAILLWILAILAVLSLSLFQRRTITR